MPAPPVYRRIASEIARQIDTGQLHPGDPLPSAREIARRWSISPATASRVGPLLRQMGYATDADPGIGARVRLPAAITAGADRWTRLRADGGSSTKAGERVEIIALEREPAPRHVADALGVEEGAEVALRRRRYLDAVGVVTLSTTWVTAATADAAPAFLAPEPLPRMTMGLIEERTGRRVCRRSDLVEIRTVPNSPAYLAELLEAQPGTPTLVVTNCYWDQHGEPSEYAVDWLGPGRTLSAVHED